MPKGEGIAINSEADIAKITHSSEQQFARVLLAHPQLKVNHEEGDFKVTQERIKQDGSRETVTLGHIPDFRVTNTNNPNVGPIHVEITQYDFDPAIDPPEEDPKARKRFVMNQRPERGRYVILYRRHLERIEQATGITIIDFNLKQPTPPEQPIAS